MTSLLFGINKSKYAQESHSKITVSAAALFCILKIVHNRDKRREEYCVITGRCLCGQVSYQTSGLPQRVGHCHCDMCRRASGSVAFTLAVFERKQVQWRGQLRHYRSSKTASRGFCAQCGTPLTYEPLNRPTKVLISLGSMDNPDMTPAEFSLFTQEKIAWLQLDEHLVQYPRWVDEENQT